MEPEITAKIASLAKRYRYKIYEVGISYYGRTYEEGKKIGMKDAVVPAWCIWKYNDTIAAKVIKFTIYTLLVLFALALLFSR